MQKKLLGVIGGMGPAASARFYSLITGFTKANGDSSHMAIALLSLPEIPDRTDFILGRSKASPLPQMQEAALCLAALGAKAIAVPCNTAEYFHKELQASCPVPILRTAYESASFAAKAGVKKLGILATEGTLKAGIYQNYLSALGVDFALPSEELQKKISELIYLKIKRAHEPESGLLPLAVRELRASGCDAAVLGCTELSLLPATETRDFFIDSLAVLAAKCVTLCGYTLSERVDYFK